MPWPIITQAELEHRLSHTKLRRFLDDDKTGAPNADAVNQFLLDASRKVAAWVALVYPIETIKTMNAADIAETDLPRLALDVAVAMVHQRHPEMAQRELGFELMKQAERDLKAVRTSETNLGTDGEPKPATDKAAVVGYTSARGNNSFAR